MEKMIHAASQQNIRDSEDSKQVSYEEETEQKFAVDMPSERTMLEG